MTGYCISGISQLIGQREYIFPTGIGKMRLIYRGFLCGGPSAGRHEVRSKKKTEVNQTHLPNARLGRYLPHAGVQFKAIYKEG